jgi:hypothetical protein
MATELIELVDGTLVEIEVPGEQIEKIAGGTAKRVDATIDKIKPILINACKPIAAAWSELNQEVNIEQAEIELGFSFEGEGNIYVTKAKAGANLTVKLVLKPKE